MKIECDKCAAKYSIADDKVRGKTFKIRCKKCGNVIIVRDKGAAGGADDAADDAGGDVAAAGWHLAVDGETVGPVADDEVRRRFRSGQIDGETAVWQEGFEDWIPLASVPAFADLVAGGGAAAADPFGASGGDDPFAAGSDAGDDGFAAASGGLSAASASFGAASSGGGLSAGGGGGGGGGGLSASPAAAKAAEPANPRATQLTGQRNENSVLFSLDSLRAMAGAAPSGGGGGGGGGGSASKVSSGGKPKVATSAPSSEGSGLIDIRAMGAVLGSGGGAAADLGGGGGSSSKSDDDVLPTFGGGGFGGLSATPLVVTPPPSAAAAAPEPKSNNTALYAIVAILALALIGLGVLVVMQMNKEPVKEVVIKEVPGSVADGDKDEEKEKEEEERKKKEEEEKKKKEEEEKAAAEAAAGDTGGEAAGGVEGTGKTGSTKSGSKSGSGKTSGSGGTATTPTGDTGTKTETKPEPKTNPADDVDCLLDPSLAKCKGGGGSKSGSGGTKSGGSTGSTTGPEKLSQTDLLDGIKGVKASAQACGSKHGVTGVKIPVKLSIEGSTGRVISASAQGDYAGKPVGNCVAAELKKAEFKKFTSAQMGFTYNVSL